MNPAYERDLDLNLLRVFVVVAEAGSVTGAAQRLYLTQPAVSAALRRLSDAVGAPLFARAGRGLVLTGRGQRLLDLARPHLAALVEAATRATPFELRRAERVVHLGLSDSAEQWLLRPLLARLLAEAPGLKLVVHPVQFRTVGLALANAAVDLAVTVADELPAGVRRAPLFRGGFVALYDPRRRPRGRLTLPVYLAAQHVIVSYNGDLRGVVEDLLGLRRDVRLSVPSFHGVGPAVDGSPLVATVPVLVAQDILQFYPHLVTAPLPFAVESTAMELLWRAAVDDDPAIDWVRRQISELGQAAEVRLNRPQGRGRPGPGGVGGRGAPGRAARPPRSGPRRRSRRGRKAGRRSGGRGSR